MQSCWNTEQISEVWRGLKISHNRAFPQIFIFLMKELKTKKQKTTKTKNPQNKTKPTKNHAPAHASPLDRGYFEQSSLMMYKGI